MWNFVYRVRSIFTSRRDLCKTMWKKQPDSSIQNNWRGCVSSGWFRDSIHLYVHICVNPDRWLSYRHNSRFLLLRICFCVKMSVQAGEIGGISDNKTLNAPWKGYVWNTTMTTDCSSSYFLFQRLFLLFSYCSFFHRQSKFTSVHLFLCTRVSSEVGYVLCFHMGDLTVTFFAFCAQ